MANTKILIVENTALFDREIETRLKSSGYSVCASVLDGEQAIEKIPETQVDLAMVYLGLEGAMAAVKTSEEIHHRFDIPVICMIDSIEEDVLERIKQVKVLGHIFKPFDENQLCLGIEQQLHWHKLIHEAKERDELQRNSINIFGDAIISTDRQGLITFMNPVGVTLTGWEIEEAIGKRVTDILDIYVGNTVNLKKSRILIDALQNGIVTAGGLTPSPEGDHNTYLIAKSGREIPIDYNVTPVKDEEETPNGMVITFRDIAKYKTTEEQSNLTISELRRQTQLMKTVFDSMYDGIVVFSFTGEILFLNPIIQQMIGKETPSTSLSLWSETHSVFYSDKETLVPVAQLMATHLAEGKEIRDLELFVRNKDRTEGIHLMASALPLFDENQEIVASVCIVRDITKDKLAATQLEQTMRQLQNQVQLTDTIFNSMGDGVIAADTNGAFTIFNPSAQRILGTGPIDTTPDKWSENYGFFFPDRVTPFPADELPLARALTGETSEEVEMFVRTPEVPDGVFISASGTPLKDGEGVRKGGVIVFRDVTHRVVAEEALTQAFAQGRLEIVETILHNIGNAINSVTVGINVLQENLVGNQLMQDFFAFADIVKAHQEDWVDYIKDDPKGQQVLPFLIALASDFTNQHREVVETLERVGERVTHISDIISTEKSSNQPGMTRKNINLERAILSVMKLQQDSIDKRGIQVYVDCENAPEEIRIQESQFHQMLVNLLKNSIEAIDELFQAGGLSETPRIGITAYVSDDFVCLEVSDNGVGIEQKNLELIFSAGYTTKESGMGLGLHSIANFVIGSGGQIHALSEGIGKGTTMRILLRRSSVIP